MSRRWEYSILSILFIYYDTIYIQFMIIENSLTYKIIKNKIYYNLIILIKYFI